MLWVGLTGGLASGKSTVSRLLKKQGVPVIDADELAHLALQPGQEPYEKAVSHFGSEILQTDQKIDRKKLAARVFNHPEQLRFLESVVHPFVQAQVAVLRKQAESQGHVVAVYDVPLLFEKNLEKQFDLTLTVGSSEETQIRRVMARNGFTREEALARLRNQLPIAEKIKRSHDSIWNEGSLEELELQVSNWLQKIRESSSKA